MKLECFGWNDYFADGFREYDNECYSVGRVSLEHRDTYVILTEQGEMSAKPIGRMYFEAVGKSDLPAVGDWVVVRIMDEDPPKAIIHAILPRASKFSRKQAGARTDEQPVAVNVDTVLVVVGLDHNYNLRRIERYLTLAWDSGAQPVVVLSKADLCNDLETRLGEVAAVAPGVPVIGLSAFDGVGIQALEEYIVPGKTLALLGSSGVGKSTIINYLLGKEIMRVQEVRDFDSRGRHTTTHRQMFVLPSGAMVVDTPGMRELQLWDAGDGLTAAFADVEELARQCRFVDCTHADEPGCKVNEALADGSLDPGRFENYLKMQKELIYLERKQDTGAIYAERMKWKKLHKLANVIKKHRER